jgi:hypothetical protein
MGVMHAVADAMLSGFGGRMQIQQQPGRMLASSHCVHGCPNRKTMALFSQPTHKLRQVTHN